VVEGESQRLEFEGLSVKFKESAMPGVTIELEGDVRYLNRRGKVPVLKNSDCDQQIDSDQRCKL
jgi:hypothetical protein